MDTEERDDAMIEMVKRIRSPLTWESPVFAKIIDLKEIHYDDVIHLIKHHYFKEDPMCRAFIHGNKAFVNEYLNLARVWMKDSTSIVALSSISGRVIGTAITRINSKLDRTNTYSRVQNKNLEQVMYMKSNLVKQADAYTFYDADTIFRVYILCCHPSYQNKGLESALLDTCIHVASTLSLTAVVGIFSSGFSQTLAANLGFRILSEIHYSRWIVDDKIVFYDPGIGNYSAACMGINVPEKEELASRLETRKLLYATMTVNQTPA